MGRYVKHKILIIDDDEFFLQSLKNLLVYQKYSVDTCSNPVTALPMLRKNNYHLVFLDVAMPGMNGLELLEKIRHNNAHIPVIMVSGQSTISTAVEAIKKGAFDFVEKPVDSEKLLVSLKNALEHHLLFLEKANLIANLKAENQIVGRSKALDNILAKVKTIAQTDVKVLITGETGTGKELIAKAIHLNSKRSSGPFVKLNCAAIPGEILESELFGHKKGAFTGAMKDKPGRIQAADGGTLFLDEIGDMDLRLQAKLLHFLQDSAFSMVGANKTQEVDVRIVAATNQNLLQHIRQGKFREDLYHRLSVVNIHIPPLRERPEDIEPLARYFLQKFCEEYNKMVIDFAPEVLSHLQQLPWRGNVRELKNFIEKTVIFANSMRIELDDLPQPQNDEKPALNSLLQKRGTLKEMMETFEKQYILKVLQENNGAVGKTAQQLGITRSALFKKKRKLGIN